MTSRGPADPEDCVLIFAPIGRDADLTRDLLERASIPCAVCRSIAALIETFEKVGGGALLVTEEAIDERDFAALATTLEQQSPWSDVPVLLFAGAPGADMS